MKIFRTKLFFVFLAGLFLLAACGKSENTNQKTNVSNQTANSNPNANLTNDDAEEFSKIVNLPVMPEEVAWRETNRENQKKLIAVLKFSAADAQTVVAQAEKRRPAASSEVDAENWFPPELVAQSQQSGDAAIKGSAYAADDFLLEPYKNGKMTRIDGTNYFVLELTDKLDEPKS